MAGSGKDSGWNGAGAGGGSGSRDGGVAGAGPWRGDEHGPAAAVRGGGASGGAFRGGGRTGSGMQRGADADRADVQPGAGAHDFLRVRILSVERSERLPGAPETGAVESAGLRERRPAWHAGAAVSAYSDRGGDGCAGGD